jgi:methyl-accepting chemotaxis protein
MRAITKHVERSSQEQGRGSKQAGRAIAGISDMVGQLQSAYRDQGRESQALVQAFEAIHALARTEQARFAEVTRVAEAAQKNALSLAGHFTGLTGE